MTNRRMLALLLAGLLTAGALTACGSTEDKPETNIPNAENGETVQETEPETEPDPFADTDFGGQSLRINSSNDFTDSTNAHRFIAGSGEMNGEIVNDAVYKRNEDVQELLNITLEITPSEWTYSNANTQIEKIVLAGDSQFDIVVNDIMCLAKLTPKAYFHSVKDTGILDFDKSYWYGDAIRDLEFVPGAMYMLLGDYFTDSLASAHVLYYNKQLIADHMGDAAYVQNIILDGKWTVDEMITLTEELTVDTNGDGTLAEGDQFGYTVIGAWGPMIPVLMGFDVQFIDNADGTVKYCFNNERSVKILEKLNALYWGNGTLPKTKKGDADDLRQKFANAETVFVGYLRLCDLEEMRDIEFGVGLAPYPKLDLEQDGYVSSLHDTSEVGAVLVTTPEEQLPFVFTCLEVLGRETSKTVIPAYYEDALKVKYVGGAEDAAMIDLIHDSITSPFAVAYNGVLGDFLLAKCFLTPLGAKQTDFASAYAKNEAAGQKTLDKVLTEFEESLAK
ncbi:MAG: hypothetical protein SOZ09_11215 [Eubacteriales bacterium]|nr:hypothetical protein [Eubacteriales bacterium]